MPKYVIERVIPGAGNLNAEQLKAISQTSCGVLSNMGPQIQWLQSYVTADKIYCVYIAPNEEMVREHAKQGGFPANAVSEVKNIIDPTTAEELLKGHIYCNQIWPFYFIVANSASASSFIKNRKTCCQCKLGIKTGIENYQTHQTYSFCYQVKE